MRALKRDTESNLEIQGQKGCVIVKNLPQVNDSLAWWKRDPLQAAPCATSRNRPEGSKVIKKHYTKKIVEDSDTPELVAFFQEHNYQFVKTIFMDTEVPPPSKRLLENSDMDHKRLSSDVDNKSEATKGTLEIISNESKLRIENYLSKGVIETCGSEKMMTEDEENTDPSQVRFIDKIAPETQLIRKVASRKADLANSINDSGCHTSKASSESEMENRSMIPHSDSSVTAVNDKDEFLQHAYYQQLLETFPESKPQDGMPESLKFSNQDFIPQHDQGGSISLSLPGPTACSGQIPYSGSTSFQSNSSSSSFVFPILPSEWNGSPVRMADADRKRFRKHPSWKLCFLCGKF